MTFTEFTYATYPITDVPRARAFYEGVLGLKVGMEWIAEDRAFIEYTVGPDTLVIGKGAPNMSPGKTGATVTLETPDFEATTKELRDKNVKFLMEPTDFPTCKMLLIEDPDGNQIMIHHRKAK